MQISCESLGMLQVTFVSPCNKTRAVARGAENGEDDNINEGQEIMHDEQQVHLSSCIILSVVSKPCK